MVRKLAKLALFLCCCFALLFLTAAGLRFLALCGGWEAGAVEQSAFAVFIEAARWALSLSLYGGILLGLSYAFRKEIVTPAAMFCTAVLSLAFSFGANMALQNAESIHTAGPVLSPRLAGGPGLIAAGSPRPSSPVVILLEGPAAVNGARVIADSGRPLRYQAAASGRSPDNRVSFNSGVPWFLKSVAIDLRLNGEELSRRLEAGLLPFFVYSGGIVFFLVSLVFIMQFSHWPLAGLIAGILAFRGVLALETFFNTPEMGEIFASFLRIRLPFSPAVPLVFCAAGILCCLYCFLMYVAKKRSDHAD